MCYGFGKPSAPVALSAFAGGVVFLSLRRRSTWLVCGTLLVAFAGGALDAAARSAGGSVLAELARDVPRCTWRATTLEQEGGLGTLVALTHIDCAGALSFDDAGLAFMRQSEPAGSRLDGEGWLVPLGDDGVAAARRRFGAAVEVTASNVRARLPRVGLLALAASVRDGLDRAVEPMPADRAGLLTGVTTGDTDALSEGVLGEFRRAGLSHIVAVSGENVVMVLGALALVTRRAGIRIRALLALLTLGFFVLVVGPQPSVLRAGAMAVVAIVALAHGLRAEPWHALLLGLVMVIALRPQTLFSAGLQMSAAATAGILLWARPLARALPGPSWMTLALAVTLSAQMATAPLIVGLFGQLSLAGPAANLFALPAVPPATVLGLCAAAAGAVNAHAGIAFARLAEPFVTWVLFVARSLGRPAWAAVSIPARAAWPLGAIVLVAAVVTARRAVVVGPVRVR